MFTSHSMSAGPTLSVIVVCLNPGARLRTALGSVWSQSGTDFELVVIDGGSTDGSREWLETQRARSATFIAEPDRGLYDAMNKAVTAARGAWVYFLGADDRLASETVLSEALAAMHATQAHALAGEAVFDDGRVYRPELRANPAARNFVHHQGTFYRRALFAEHGGFDASLHIMADYDLNVRLWKRRVRFEPLSLRIAICGAGGRSDSGAWRGYREEIAVRHRHFPAAQCLLWDAVSVARCVRKKIVRRSAHA